MQYIFFMALVFSSVSLSFYLACQSGGLLGKYGDWLRNYGQSKEIQQLLIDLSKKEMKARMARETQRHEELLLEIENVKARQKYYAIWRKPIGLCPYCMVPWAGLLWMPFICFAFGWHLFLYYPLAFPMAMLFTHILYVRFFRSNSR